MAGMVAGGVIVTSGFCRALSEAHDRCEIKTLIISTDFVKGLRNGHLKTPMMIALRRSESFADCFGIIMTPATPGVSRCQSQVVRTTDLGKKCYTLRQEIESHPVFQGFQNLVRPQPLELSLNRVGPLSARRRASTWLPSRPPKMPNSCCTPHASQSRSRSWRSISFESREACPQKRNREPRHLL